MIVTVYKCIRKQEEEEKKKKKVHQKSFFSVLNQSPDGPEGAKKLLNSPRSGSIQSVYK